MESLERSKEVIELGKRLVAQLKLGNDELAQWMAHMLAERIHDAENSPPEVKVAAQSSCAELVFQLWEHRYSLPARLCPFKKLEPLLRTLDTLDTSNGPRFRFMQDRPADVEVEEDVEKVLSLAVKLDDVARTLVHYLLATAVEQASEESKPWIQSATHAAADVTLEVRIVDFVKGGTDRSNDDVKIAREILEDKIQKLESFVSAAASYAADLRAKHNLLVDEAKDVETDDE